MWCGSSSILHRMSSFFNENIDTSNYRRVPVMTLNSIWWWGSSSGVLRNVEYPFIAITPRSTLSRSGSTSQSPINWSNRTRARGITLNCIWRWGSSPGTLGDVKYPFIAITPRSTLTLSSSTCQSSMVKLNSNDLLDMKLFNCEHMNDWY